MTPDSSASAAASASASASASSAEGAAPSASPRRPVVLPPGGGRPYPMGRIDAVFKADGSESAGRYAISEWWLEPHSTGPGAHSHDEDDVFYVLSGTMSILVDTDWVDAEAGAFVLVPGGVKHDFENRGEVRAGILNFSAPGNFEPAMPEIQQWFLEHPPQRPAQGLGKRPVQRSEQGPAT